MIDTMTTTKSMSSREAAIFADEVGGAEPRLSVRSDTRVDTGRWLRHSRLWVCVMSDGIVLFAAAKRRYIERLELAQCRDSYYCQSAGALVIEPAEDVRFKRLAMPPTDALQVIHHIEQALDQSKQKLSNATENNGA